ncbi:MAG: hypothetical protein FWD06_08030, partial [Oscillospiraceae bacterium]|nr:hypothetical protein [Oscillospiraceae bacterium]
CSITSYTNPRFPIYSCNFSITYLNRFFKRFLQKKCVFDAYDPDGYFTRLMRPIYLAFDDFLGSFGVTLDSPHWNDFSLLRWAAREGTNELTEGENQRLVSFRIIQGVNPYNNERYFIMEGTMMYERLGQTYALDFVVGRGTDLANYRADMNAAPSRASQAFRFIARNTVGRLLPDGIDFLVDAHSTFGWNARKNDDISRALQGGHGNDNTIIFVPLRLRPVNF